MFTLAGFMQNIFSHRVEQSENIEDNRKNLTFLTQRVFNAIIASAER